MNNFNIKVRNVFGGGLHFDDTYELVDEKNFKKVIRKYIKLISDKYDVRPTGVYYTNGLNITGFMKDSFEEAIKSTSNVNWFIRKVAKHYMRFPIACFTINFSDGEMYDFDITEE